MVFGGSVLKPLGGLVVVTQEWTSDNDTNDSHVCIRSADLAGNSAPFVYSGHVMNQLQTINQTFIITIGAGTSIFR